jgi:TonB family protein
MMEVLALITKATIVLVLSLLTTVIARRAKASMRAAVLTASFATLVVLPLLSRVMPSRDIAVPVPRAIGDQSAVALGVPAAPVLTEAPNRLSHPTERPLTISIGIPSTGLLLAVLWGLGAVICMMPVVATLTRLLRIRRGSVVLPDMSDTARLLAIDGGRSSGVSVLGSEEIEAPIIHGWLRPVIVMPRFAEEWAPHQLRHALVHELEHIRRHDWLVQVGARTTCALYWFHPLVWIAWRRLRLECERACDDAVVRVADGPVYAQQLVTLARGLSSGHASVLSMATGSDLSARISAILDVHQLRGRAGKAGVVAVTVVASGVVLALAPLRAIDRATSDLAELRRGVTQERQGTGTLTGYVYDPLGDPVADLQILLENVPGTFGYGDVTRTDASGNFVFSGLPTGEFKLTAGDFFPASTVKVLDGEAIERDVHMTRPSLVIDFGVCAECPFVEPYVPPPSLIVELQQDRDARLNSPVVGPAPVGGWEFDQPRPIPYPSGPREASLEGTVVIEGQIGTDGFAAGLRVVSGHPELAAAALAVLRERQWEPARVRGSAVEVPMHAEFRYTFRTR